MTISAVTDFLSIFTLLGNFALVAFIGLVVWQRLSGKTYSLWQNLLKISKRFGLLFAFMIAAAATVGSLFYSELLGYKPCELCWIQRIFIYPQNIILGIALVKKFKKEVVYYSSILSIIGVLIAAYQYYLQRFGGPDTPCLAVDYRESCTKNFILYFGYITIPMMSLTAFGLIIASVYLYYQAQPKAH